MNKFITLKMGVLFVALAILSGCTAIKLIQSAPLIPPEVTFVEHKLGKANRHSLPVTLVLKATNKNDIGLQNVFIQYELFTEGKRFLSGQDIRLSLIPNGDTRIKVPADIIYQDVLKVLGPTAKKVLQKDETIPVLAKIRLYGKPKVYNQTESGELFSFSINTEKVIDVPIPHDQINELSNELKNTAVKKLKKFKSRF